MAKVKCVFQDNEVKKADLAAILRLTPPAKRLKMAMAWADLTITSWAGHAGLQTFTVSRWFTRKTRMSLKDAQMLVEVVGVDLRLLFEDYL